VPPAWLDDWCPQLVPVMMSSACADGDVLSLPDGVAPSAPRLPR